MSDILVFESIKSDFADDAAAGRANMRITFDKFTTPAGNKNGGAGGYLYQTDTNFFYKGVQYTSLIVENFTITGIMKVNGATPLVSRSKIPEFFNFVLIKDEKCKEAFKNALTDPANKGILTIENKEDGTYSVKPNILKKEYSGNVMLANKEGVLLDDPPMLLKLRVQPTLKYIYSCTIDLVKSDGTIESLKPRRSMPQNSLADIKKTMKSQVEYYFGGQDLEKMFAEKKFVHDLPMQVDIEEFIPAYSKVIMAEFELNCKCNISKQTAWINCDFLPSYLQIKPNPKYDIGAKVNRMRNHKSNISQAELNQFDEPPEDEFENNDNL